MGLSYLEAIKKVGEFDFPSFIKFGQSYSKVIDKYKLIVVTNYSFCMSIEIGVIAQNNPISNDGWKFITEEEFNTVFNEVFNKISDLTNQSKELILQ